MELRKPSLSKPVALPVDYLKMVADVFRAKFVRHLEEKNQSISSADWTFDAYGEVAPEEIALAISMRTDSELSAKTVYASLDFDRVEEVSSVLLEVAVDALDSVFSEFFSEINQDVEFFDMKNIPFEWTKIKMDKKEIFVRVDRSNLALELAADHWLQANDPLFLESELQAQEETKKKFITGVR